jgi:outer membrane protein W
VHVGQIGRAVPIAVLPDKDLGASAIVLRYRAATASAFADLPFQKGPAGAFEAAIPASATTGQQVVYFIEARRADGSVIVRRGSATDPMVVALVEAAKPAVAGTAHPTQSAKATPQFYFALLGGTGVGTASGTGEETQNSVASSGIAWTRAGQLAPEIGYFVTPRLRLGVQARLQLITGATPYHLPNPMSGECGSDNICSSSTGAFAGLLKATWLLVEPESAFQPYVSLAAGAGTIRHVMKVSSPPTCGSSGTEACMDTVAAGPALFGPGIGFQYRVSDTVGLVVELDGLVGAPHFTANADLNVGVAFQL